MLKRKVPQESVKSDSLIKKQPKMQENGIYKIIKNNKIISNYKLDPNSLPAFPSIKTSTVSLVEGSSIIVTEGVDISENVTIPNLDVSGVSSGSEVVITVHAKSLTIQSLITSQSSIPVFTFHLKYYDTEYTYGINDIDNKMNINLPEGFDSNAVNWVLFTTASSENDIVSPDSETVMMMNISLRIAEM